MTASNRETAIKLTLGYEGGYTNDAADPGGPTNWGITIIDARKYWKSTATAYDVRTMPLSVALGIYREKYWAVMKCDSDPDGVDFATFDYGVNSGVGRAVPCRKANTNPSAVEWVKGICDDRLRFLTHLRTWGVFGKGWGRRVSDVKARGVKMAYVALGAKPDDIKRELNAEAKSSAGKAAKSAQGAGATTLAPASTQAPQVPHHVDLSALSLGGKVAAAVIAVSALGLVFYFTWRWWHHRADAAAFAQVAKET